ncbi:DROUGHT SENSITIVE 1 [Hibiscus trionum]|uniref:DROUGHT SENSITIVE 1 n=1 Tax=Hibiscus trionum TaxID=183268 RepID=A0A9W7MMJ7_HIBTR|nr:DROUGHT SENSITIVE 1 [Hibiscus trionum]
MASQKLTEYERKRLENIKRNADMVAALNIPSKAATLSAAKRQRTKTHRTSKVKKPTTQDPIITRQSLRPRGMASDSADESVESISMIDAYRGVEKEYNQVLVDTILSISKETQIGFPVNEDFNGVKDVKNDDFSENGTLGSCKTEALESLDLKPETVACLAPGRTTVVKFFPSNSIRMIAAGNKFGDISFWNVDCETEDGVYVYRTHSGPISGILIPQHSLSKIYSCGHDGFIRLMDAEKEVFDLVHSSDDAIHYLSQQPNNPTSLYFAGAGGGLNVRDSRTGKSGRNWILHEDRINTISFSSHNPNIMATGSADGTACIWDLRSTSSRRNKSLKTVSHGEAVNSAYFSPSGSSLATTSLDNNVGITSGINFEDTSMIYHENSMKFPNLSFRGIWGWDDSYIFIGNVKKGVDVVSPARRGTVVTLPIPKGSSIPYRFDTHPCEVGMLAAANNSGQVSLWTP